jgi:hypothetical protein
MPQRWESQDDGTQVDGAAAVLLIGSRIAIGQLETWFSGSPNRLLSFITNGERAMVMFLKSPDDPGEHLSDPQAGDGFSTGYRLSNGQVDEYADSDTAPLPLALAALKHRIDTGKQEPIATWIEDR